jgi:Galactose oxidase, central domain
MLFRSLSVVLVVSVLGLSGHAGEIPVNKWTSVGSSKFAMPRDGNYPRLIGCKLVWDEKGEQAVILPTFARLEADYWSFSVKKGWARQKGKPPAKLLPNRRTDPQAYCYLPGLKKILFLKGKWYASKDRKTPVSSWLFDPSDGSWKNLPSVVRMSHKSIDYEPAACRDGAATPRWGQLVYDPHNKEAVLFGGGCTWGRVDKVKSQVAPGDWIYDEAKKRCRRLTAEDKGKVISARRWFPAHCGTWTFSEAEKKWKPIDQPLNEQPSGRILPGMAYDSAEKKIVLFGGDDLARCFADTWVYDCKTRKWKQVVALVRPGPRAGHGMAYDPVQKAIILVGGYTGGWKALNDVWVFKAKESKWQRLGLDLPGKAFYASASYLPAKKAIAVGSYASGKGNRSLPVHLLKLNLASAPKAQAPEATVQSAYHCRNKRRPTDLPGEWLKGKGAPEPKGSVLARIKAFPANTWKNMKPPKPAPERNWGSYIYDIRTHQGFAWGGGHSAYPGAEMSTYDLLSNRWDGMAQATNYNPIWLHGMVGGPPGLSFGGWSLLASHARKSYGVDPLSDSVVTFVGDVFSIKHRSFVKHIGRYPIRFGYSDQVAFCTTPHGLYGFSSTPHKSGSGFICKANVKAGKWEIIDKSGPKGHRECDFLCYDSKRDRLLYFKRTGAVLWTFDFKSKKWAEEQPAGKKPPAVKGDATYIPEMDAVLTVFTTSKGGKESLYFYKCAEKKWYTAPSVGDPFRGGNGGKDWSPIYDPELKIIVRITPTGFHQWLNVHVMRLEPKSLKLTPIEPEASP